MIRLENINLSYHKPLIVNGRLELPGSSITAIIGKSGLGKTTLLNQLGFIDNKWGEHVDYYFNEEKLNGKNVLELYRNNYFYLFQNNNLVDQMSCFDNIIFLATMRGIHVTREEIFGIFERLQVDIDLSQYPTQISGGQRQKLEIAILAVLKPKVILCDEITSALDGVSAIEIFQLLKQIVREIHATCIMVVHDPKIIEQCDHIYEVKDEKLVPIRFEASSETIELQPSKKLTIKTYFTYAILKLMNPKFLQQSLIVGLLFTVMITSFNLIYRYNHDNKLKLADSLLHVDNHEFIFDHGDDLSFEATDLYEYPVTIENQEVMLVVGNSKKELENHLAMEIVKRGVYINIAYADMLGITSNQQHKEIMINGECYLIAGVVEDEYYLGNKGLSVYATLEDDIIHLEKQPNKMMYYEEDIHELANIEKEITDHGLTIYSSLSDYSNNLKHNEQINFFINLLLGAVVVILVVFAVIYSIIQYETKKKEITLLYNRGFRLGSLSFLNFSENLGILLIIIIISPLITQLITHNLVKNQIFYTKESMLGIYFLISLLTGLLVFELSQFMISLIYLNVRRKEG